MKLILFIAVLYLSWSAIGSNFAEALRCYSDYYWRDYSGKIPGDAVEGGQRPSGTPFYIGQVYDPDRKAFFPAQIFRGKSQVLFVSTGKVKWTSTQVKILCSKHRDNFKWRQIETSNLHTLTDTHVVIGGEEDGAIMYIGRVFDETSQVLGKIFKQDKPYKGIWIPSRGIQVNFQKFDILTYSCQDSISTPYLQ